MKCKICDNSENNDVLIGKEMMFGLRDEFEYLKCSKCGCLQIIEIPDNIEKYYSADYYSYSISQEKTDLKSRIASFLLKHSIKDRILGFDLLGRLAVLYNTHYKTYLPWLHGKYCNYDTSILDVGCGAGELLLKMQTYGFKNLEGIDPYISHDIEYCNSLFIRKKDIYGVTNKYDFIMLHHSFEHMSEPRFFLNQLKNILSKNGTILIRIPVADGYAWRKYGMDWFQVDAPRHLFLHTIKSITQLADQANLKLDSVFYDSTEGQMMFSEQYLRNIPLKERVELYSQKELSLLKKQSKLLNDMKDGDQACFYLKHQK